MKKKKKPFDVLRGDVFYADLGKEEDVIGSEQFWVRPILVTQSNHHKPDKKGKDGLPRDSSQDQRSSKTVHGLL